MLENVCNTCLIFWSLSRSECASWVQAWGSIGAIVFSVLAVRHAHNLQARQRRQDAHDAYTQFLEGLLHLLVGARHCARKIYAIEEAGKTTPAEYMLMKIELSTLDDAMSRVPLDRFDRSQFTEAWVTAQMHIRSLRSGVDYITSPIASKQLERNFVRDLAEEARKEIDTRANRIAEGIKSRKSAVLK